MNDNNTLVRRFADLSSPQVFEMLQKNRLIIPIGAIEQHGPHLPLNVDLIIACAFADELARRLGAYVAPEIAYAARSLPHSGGGPFFRGTISVRGTTLINYFVDIFSSYAQSGARSFVIINGHYENEPFLMEAMEVCREAQCLQGVEVILLGWWSVVSQNFIDEVFDDHFPGWHAEHAGICETSLMLYLHPSAVAATRPNHSHPPIAGVYLHPIDPTIISNQGVLTITRGSSAEIGQKLFNHVCEGLEKLIQSPHGLKKI